MTIFSTILCYAAVMIAMQSNSTFNIFKIDSRF